MSHHFYPEWEKQGWGGKYSKAPTQFLSLFVFFYPFSCATIYGFLKECMYPAESFVADGMRDRQRAKNILDDLGSTEKNV